MKVYVWEEELTDDKSTLVFEEKRLGYIEPIGASWQVFYGTALIAVRPDKAAAQTCLIKYHEAAPKA